MKLEDTGAVGTGPAQPWMRQERGMHRQLGLLPRAGTPLSSSLPTAALPAAVRWNQTSNL